MVTHQEEEVEVEEAEVAEEVEEVEDHQQPGKQPQEHHLQMLKSWAPYL